MGGFCPQRTRFALRLLEVSERQKLNDPLQTRRSASRRKNLVFNMLRSIAMQERRDKPEIEVMELFASSRGKEIWLFGGGELFRSLAQAKLVDTVEVGGAPVLLGGGISAVAVSLKAD